MSPMCNNVPNVGEAEKERFNQVQDLNLDSNGYTFISPNLIFCLLTYLTEINK